MRDAQQSRSRQVSRRKFLQGIGIGSTTLLAGSVSGAGAGRRRRKRQRGPRPPRDIELDFFAWGDASDIPAWEELATTYGEQNPNVTVKPSISGTGVDYYTKLQTSFAGGVVPEIASFQGWEWQPFSDAGLLAPIDALYRTGQFQRPVSGRRRQHRVQYTPRWEPLSDSAPVRCDGDVLCEERL